MMTPANTISSTKYIRCDMGKKVSVDNLASEINKILEEFQMEVDLGVASVAELTAKKGAAALNTASKGVVRKRRKAKGVRYGSSWKVTAYKKRLYTDVVIHSRKPGLPHLLEYSHKVGEKGHYSGRTHIAPVEAELVKAFEDGIVRFIQKH